jgi:hypothetical protein
VVPNFEVKDLSLQNDRESCAYDHAKFVPITGTGSSLVTGTTGTRPSLLPRLITRDDFLKILLGLMPKICPYVVGSKLST